ncbi:MAG: hypothetical protein WD403_11045 [Pirellulales bacterium]
MATDIEKLIEEVRGLPPEEQRRIRTVLDEELSSPSLGQQSPKEELHRRLIQSGLLKEVKPPITDLEPYKNRQPFKIEGKPLSETVIEERR